MFFFFTFWIGHSRSQKRGAFRNVILHLGFDHSRSHKGDVGSNLEGAGNNSLMFLFGFCPAMRTNESLGPIVKKHNFSKKKVFFKRKYGVLSTAYEGCPPQNLLKKTKK